MKQFFKAGFPIIALVAMLAFASPRPAAAAHGRFGVYLGSPVYPTYSYPYDPYYGWYAYPYNSYVYPYNYGYAYPYGYNYPYYGGFYWGGGRREGFEHEFREHGFRSGERGEHGFRGGEGGYRGGEHGGHRR